MHNTLSITRNEIIGFKMSFFPKIFRLFVFSLAFFLVIFCIFQVNAYTKAYYSIQKTQVQVDNLTKENGNLEISFSNINSLNNINEHIKDFEGINKMEYIKILDKTVLAK